MEMILSHIGVLAGTLLENMYYNFDCLLSNNVFYCMIG